MRRRPRSARLLLLAVLAATAAAGQAIADETIDLELIIGGGPAVLLGSATDPEFVYVDPARPFREMRQLELRDDGTALVVFADGETVPMIWLDRSADSGRTVFLSGWLGRIVIAFAGELAIASRQGEARDGQAVAAYRVLE